MVYRLDKQEARSSDLLLAGDARKRINLTQLFSGNFCRKVALLLRLLAVTQLHRNLMDFCQLVSHIACCVNGGLQICSANCLLSIVNENYLVLMPQL